MQEKQEKQEVRRNTARYTYEARSKGRSIGRVVVLLEAPKQVVASCRMNFDTAEDARRWLDSKVHEISNGALKTIGELHESREC